MGFKRIGASVLIAALLLSLVPAMAGAAVQDVVGTRFQAAVTYLKDLGVVEGRPEGFFPMEPITRAEATKIIVLILGHEDLAALLKGAPSFKDVPSAHWASGYIAVARNNGIINGYPDGTFRPESLVTYAEFAKMLVEAAGLSPTPVLGWPANYVDAAARAGMVANVGFQADAPAIRGDCAIMGAFTVQEVENPTTGKTLGQSVFGEMSIATLELTPPSYTVAIGAAVYFSVVAKDASGVVVPDVTATFTTTNPTTAVIQSNGRFAATYPGVYTVTAAVGQLTATAVVNVYGTPVALKATASPSKIVANGVSTSKITVEVVDASGTKVPNAENAVTISYEDNDGAVTLPDDTTVEAVNGAATFTVTATTNEDATDELEFKATGLESTTVKVKTVEPDASSLLLTANPPSLPANEEFFGTVTAVVLDQDGVRMTSGTYYITFSISGDGYLEGDDDPVPVATVNQEAEVEISSEAGDAGTIRITATATGIRSASISVKTYIAGSPKAIKVTKVDTEGETGDEDDMEIIVGLVDSKGQPAMAEEVITVEFVLPDDSGLIGLGTVTFNVDDSYQTVTFHGTKSGTFEVDVRDEDTADPEVTATEFTCKVTATDIEAIAVTPAGDPVIYLPITNPQLTVTAQLTDSLGNAVAKSGVRVQFSADINGDGSVTWSKTGGKATTDSNGKATIVMTGQGYSGNAYTVECNADTDKDGDYNDAGGSTKDDAYVVTDAVPDQIDIAFKSPGGSTISSVKADDSAEARCHITLEDRLGNPVDEDGFDIEVTFSNSGRNVLAGSVDVLEGTLEDSDDNVYWFKTDDDGEVVFAFQGGLAGSFNVTAKCLNTLDTVSETDSFKTVAGTAIANGMILKTDNTPAKDMTVKANRAVSVRLALVDNGGNPVAAPDDMIVYFEPDRPTGEYRLSSSGVEVTQVAFTRGMAYKALYYVDSQAGTDVDMYNDVTDYDAYEITASYNAGTGKVEALVTGIEGTPVQGISVTLRRTAGEGEFTGGVTTITGTTNSSGIYAVTYSDTGGETVEAELTDGMNMDGGSLEEVSDTVSF